MTDWMFYCPKMKQMAPSTKKPARRTKNTTTLTNDLKNAIKGNYDGFATRFSEVDCDWENDDFAVSGRFLYPSFSIDGNPTVNELVQYVYWRIIPFCIPQQERDAANDNYDRTKDERYRMEITDKARSLFARAKKTQKSTGEPGELILFVFLEALLNAPQIACKMYLKTNGNVPVHGSDSIHATLGQIGTNLNIVWGESKTYEQINPAFDKICTSIASFLKSGNSGERPPRERDIDIIKDHLNITQPELRAAVLEYLDPYCEKFNQREETYAVLVVYQDANYNKLKKPKREQREQVFKTLYDARIRESCQYLCDKLHETGLSHIAVKLFLLPVPDIQMFRKEFFIRLGVPESDIQMESDVND